jgi:hypothetical protein
MLLGSRINARRDDVTAGEDVERATRHPNRSRGCIVVAGGRDRLIPYG